MSLRSESARRAGGSDLNCAHELEGSEGQQVPVSTFATSAATRVEGIPTFSGPGTQPRPAKNPASTPSRSGTAEAGAGHALVAARVGSPCSARAGNGSGSASPCA
jgi:hypothetical protein